MRPLLRIAARSAWNRRFALSLVVLLARHDAGTFGMPTLGMSADDFGALAYNLALIVFVGGSVLVATRAVPGSSAKTADTARWASSSS